MDGETIPLRAQPHEEIVEDCVRPHPSLAAGHVGIALRLIPLDVRAHRPENRGDVSAAERVVEILQKRYVVHIRSSIVKFRPNRRRAPGWRRLRPLTPFAIRRATAGALLAVTSLTRRMLA